MILLSVIGTLLIISVLGVCALAILQFFRSKEPPQCFSEKRVNSTDSAMFALDIDDEGSDSSGPLTTKSPKSPAQSQTSKVSKPSRASPPREPSSESINFSLSEDTVNETAEIRIHRIPKNSDSLSPRGTMSTVGIHRVQPIDHKKMGKIPINRNMLRENTDLLYRVMNQDLHDGSRSNSRGSVGSSSHL